MTSTSNGIRGLIREIRRRRVLQSTLLYIVFCWGLLEAWDVLLPSLGIENPSASRWMLVAAISGFPIMILFSWFFQLTSSGIVKTGAFVDRRVLNNIPPIGDRRHDGVAAYFRGEEDASIFRWCITAESGALVGLTYGIESSITFGRAPDCDLTLPSSGVSRHHARIYVEDDMLFIEDLNSANGCLVNGQRVEQTEQLNHGDELLLQNNLFRVSENYAWDDKRATALSQTTYIKPTESSGSS